MDLYEENVWKDTFNFPITGRNYKPRTHGLTMVIDKGMGLVQMRDLLEVSGEYIDFIKLGFGTSALYNQALLQKKITLIHNFETDIYPGGTFFEVAWLQNKVTEYFSYVKEMGFSAVEISDGTAFITPNERQDVIKYAKTFGFKILTEVGKKDPTDTPTVSEMVNQLKNDTNIGAEIVIIEGRESGKGIGMYDNNGNIKKDDFDSLLSAAKDFPQIMWEAPLKKQQHELISVFGPNVNLGNIASQDVMALEALRVGLRGDTLKDTLNKEGFKNCAST